MHKLLFVILFVLVGCNDMPNINEKPIKRDPVITAPTTVQESSDIQWNAHFSPNGGCTTHVVEELGKAQQSVYVQAYSFTSVPIAQALMAAHQRGVHVEVILDKSDRTGKGSVLPMLVGHGITTYIDDKHAIAHNKIMIIDKKTVFTGSFNFTNAAEHSNAENSIELTNAKIAETYQQNWDHHKEHSTRQSL
jgi:phosphatidylserine/phosphatidylglycerophosphate/cardiolipin synthase-like enzyme